MQFMGDPGIAAQLFVGLRHGCTGMALAAMLHRDGWGSTDPAGWRPPTGQPHFARKAKSVIWLFMNGGVSHMESCDPKPMLAKYAGQSIDETPFADFANPNRLKNLREFAKGNNLQWKILYGPQIGFQKRGQSGIEVSDWFPYVRSQVDKLAIVRSMWMTDNDHGAQVQFHSGRHLLEGQFPTLGAWVHYGLGSLNDNLPQFISIGKRQYWNRKDGYYLGPAHDAVALRINPKDPLDFGSPEGTITRKEQSLAFEL